MSEEQRTKEFPDELAVSADWETYYSTKEKYSLTTMPTWQYCADERFNPYLLAMCGKDIYDESVFSSGSWKEGETLTVFNEAGDMFRKLPDGRHLYVGDAERFTWWDKIDNRLIICHNASFDQVVFHECWKRGMLPRLKNVKWACTADLASYLMAPRNLKGAMKELFGLEISKEVRAAMDGRLPQHLNAEEYRALVEYGGADAIECHDLWLKYAHEWPYIERRISELNRESTMRGIKLNAEYVRASLKELESYLAVVACDIPWYPEKALGSLPALKKAVMEMGLVPPKSFKKDDPGFLRWQEQNGNIPFIKARQKAISISMCIARLKTMVETMDTEDRSHPAFLYFGSHTGRFSGRSESGGNMNLLNLPRKPVMSGDKNVFDGAGIDIRGSYIADPGRSFYIADYAQIEARMSLWLVDDVHMMEALKREGNLYAANAVAMNWCKSGDDIKNTNPDLYRLAKCCLTADTLILVRTEKSNGQLTKPYYKRIIQVTIKDWVWDGREWVKHLGVEKMKEVKSDELIETGGVCLTKDHRVYISDTESRRADEVFGDTETTAVSWGQANNPVRGWSHVRILAAALFRVGARALYLCAREALHLLAGALRLHRVRNGGSASVGQCSQGYDDAMHAVRSQSFTTESCTECVGEDA